MNYNLKKTISARIQLKKLHLVVAVYGARLSHCYSSRYLPDDIVIKSYYGCNLFSIGFLIKIGSDMYHSQDFFLKQRDEGVT